MPYLRPGVVHYSVATKQVVHGNPCIEDNIAGIAIKQQEQSWQLGIANRNVVAIGEPFAICHKGQTKIAASLIASPAKGDPLYIRLTDNTFVKTPTAGYVPFGRIMSLAGDNRGTPTGFVIVDMDARDTL